MEESSSDRGRVSRGTDHGDGARRQEGPHRVDGCLRLALGKVLERLVGETDREFRLDLSPGLARIDTGTARPEVLDHRVVLGEHVRHERRYPMLGRRLRQLTDQDRADPPALELIGDRAAHLCAPALPRTYWALPIMRPSSPPWSTSN